MKKNILAAIFFLALTNLYGQSIEFSPAGLVNLKIGNSYSAFSPISPENKFLIYNRGGHSAGISLVDSSDNGSTNVSVIYSKASGIPQNGLFIGNLSNSPIVFFNNNNLEKNLFVTPNGSVGINHDMYGIGGSQKMYSKLFVRGFGDSLFNFQSIGLSSINTFAEASGGLQTNTNRIALVGQTDGLGSSSENITNIGVLGISSAYDSSYANGIGVHAISKAKTNGYSAGLMTSSKNLGFGSSYGLNLESYSKDGSTFGISSTVNGNFLNYGIHSNVITALGSLSPSYGFYSNILNAGNSNAVYGYFADVSKNNGLSFAYGSYLKVKTTNGSNAVGNFSQVTSNGSTSFGSLNNSIGNATNYAVFGYANNGTQNIAIYGSLGENTLSTDYAGYFEGNVHVAGILSKSSGTFKIDHPLDPANKTLSHSFVESPEMMNIYNGNIITDDSGTATVILPNYFEALNENFRYQLTVIGKFSQAIVFEKIKGNSFKIKTSEPNTEVSWQVTGTRKDAFAKQNPIIVEEEKSINNKGKYLNPKVFGKTSKEGMFKVDYEN